MDAPDGLWLEFGPLLTRDVHKSGGAENADVREIWFSSVPEFIRRFIVRGRSAVNPVQDIYSAMTRLCPEE